MMSGFELGVAHGKKRPSEEELEGEQPLTKRFNRLQIDPRYRVASNSSSVPTHIPAQDDSMHVDETKHKVYIHDLDAELAEIEDNEPKIEFLPDIEKKLAAFPSLLETRVLSPSQGQLILYKPMSVPQEVSNARKAIIASRKAMRENQGVSRQSNGMQGGQESCGIFDQDNRNSAGNIQMQDDDTDAMDIG